MLGKRKGVQVEVKMEKKKGKVETQKKNLRK